MNLQASACPTLWERQCFSLSLSWMPQKLRVYTNIYQIMFSCKAEIPGWLLLYMTLQASASPTFWESQRFSLFLSQTYDRNLGFTQMSTKSCFPAKLKLLVVAPIHEFASISKSYIARKPRFLAVTELKMPEKLWVYTKVHQIIVRCKFLGGCFNTWICRLPQVLHCEEGNFSSLFLSWICRRKLVFMRISTKSCFPAKLFPSSCSPISQKREISPPWEFRPLLSYSMLCNFCHKQDRWTARRENHLSSPPCITKRSTPGDRVIYW